MKEDIIEVLTRSVITEKVPKIFKVSAIDLVGGTTKVLDVYSPKSMLGCRLCCPYDGHGYYVWINALGEYAVHGKIGEEDNLFFYTTT